MRLADLNIGEISFHNQEVPKGLFVEGRLHAAIAKLALWRDRARQRAELARMDYLERLDIGVTGADVWREVRKLPWEC